MRVISFLHTGIADTGGMPFPKTMGTCFWEKSYHTLRKHRKCFFRALALRMPHCVVSTCRRGNTGKRIRRIQPRRQQHRHQPPCHDVRGVRMRCQWPTHIGEPGPLAADIAFQFTPIVFQDIAFCFHRLQRVVFQPARTASRT